jgi:hypothetical protein
VLPPPFSIDPILSYPLTPSYTDSTPTMETNYTAALGPAVDLSHHLSELARSRRFSPLKVRTPSTLGLAVALPDAPLRRLTSGLTSLSSPAPAVSR